MKDLTATFQSLTVQAKKNRRRPAPSNTNGNADLKRTGHVPKSAKTRSQEAIYFTQRASQISDGINRASLRLGHLAALAKSRTSFKDQTDQINVMSAQINEEVNILQTELVNLESYLESNKTNIAGGSESTTRHSKTVVETMSRQLTTAAKQFKGVLETRQSIVQEQEKRRSRFSAPKNRRMAKPATFQPAASQPSLRQRGVHDGNNEGLYAPQANEESRAEATAMLEQAQLVPEQNYFESRANAMQFIESQLGSIDQLMGNLAEMVQQQSDVIVSIDESVEETRLNLEAGRGELMQYLEYISGNRVLFLKIFFVLLFFLTFFIVFMA